MKFVTALLFVAAAFVGINAKCVEEANEEFFLLPATSKAKAEQRCIENGGILAEINDRNQNNAASAVAACTEAESGSVDVWIKSWNTDSYNNVESNSYKLMHIIVKIMLNKISIFHEYNINTNI
ncbi:hypothetical protein U3516DRAFT_823840 [Neocallimastix sp. 'constans']